MTYEYDHSFSPYVIPAGSPFEPDSLPDLRWFAKMAVAQTRSFVGASIIRMRQRLPLALEATSVGRGLGSLHERFVPAAAGRVPTTGDAEFAYQRFAGTNPVVIARVREVSQIPEKLRIGDELYGRVMGGGNDSTQRLNRDPIGTLGCRELAKRVARGDVFILRFDALRVRSEAELQPGKFVAPCTALFCHAPEMDSLFPVVPLAILCPTGRPDGETNVFTPLSEQRWRDAKRLVGVADVNDSELRLHLARAHFMTVPFAIALRRKLPREHPLHLFLLPHLRFDMFVDRMAWLKGMKKTSGILLRSLAGRAEWSQDVARSLYYALSFREQHFERDLEARGLDSHPVDYPYRDDGRTLWSAIERYVDAFVRCTYPSQRALASDQPLHAFLRDAADPKGGNVRGLLAGARLETTDELIEILTQIIFVAGPLHALVHYSSAAQLQHVDENPSFLTANPLSSLYTTEPGPLRAMHQYTRVVGTNCRYDQLGDFSHFEIGKRPEYRRMIADFSAELDSIERTIVERNERRFAPFIHFLPSRISNGITI